jgi:SGNH domain (fused to AT3 domains)
MMGARRISLLVAASSLFALPSACGTATTGSNNTSAPASQLAAPIHIGQFANASQVAAAVTAGASITKMTPSVVSQLRALAAGGGIGAGLAVGCPAATTLQRSVNVANCTFGDTESSKTMMLVGDSRAAMWFDVIDRIATAAKMKLIFLNKSACPAALGNFRLTSVAGVPSNMPWPACTAFHKFVLATIKKLAPSVVVVSSSDELYLMDAPGYASASQVVTASASFLKAIPAPTKAVVLGDFPNPGVGAGNPVLCLSRNSSDISKCNFTVSALQRTYNSAQHQAATQAGAGFIDQHPWFCAAQCPAVIAGIIPYTVDAYHMQSNYAAYLIGVLWAALNPYLHG